MDYDLDASAEAAASGAKKNPREASAELETVANKKIKFVSIDWDDSSSDEEEDIDGEDGNCLDCLSTIFTLCKSKIDPNFLEKLRVVMRTMPVS
jgi:hypothetical protein